MGVREWVIPHDVEFYDLFVTQVSIVVEAADALVHLVENKQNIPAQIHAIKDLEHKGDRVTHEIYKRLNVTFLTPLEPEEISQLASALDDILDFIDISTRKIGYYSITEADAPMRELAKLIQLSTIELHAAIMQIKKGGDLHGIEARCIEVNRLENLADDVLAGAITDLFQSRDPIHILKLKDIYESLETATDKCEDVTNVLSDIAIRHG